MNHPSNIAPLRSVLLGALACLFLLGCQTGGPVASSEILEMTSKKYDAILLREGDVVRISFPGAPNLDNNYTIRRDGKISLTQVGEITAIGKTPAELEKEVLKLYEPQLVVKQVSVTLGSSAYPIFVIGAVLKPGKVMAERPLSVFEAVMEAGGFDFARANTKEVLILREGDQGMTSIKLNLKDTLQGKPTKPFYLRPSDVVYVREKFSWF